MRSWPVLADKIIEVATCAPAVSAVTAPGLSTQLHNEISDLKNLVQSLAARSTRQKRSCSQSPVAYRQPDLENLPGNAFHHVTGRERPGQPLMATSAPGRPYCRSRLFFITDHSQNMRFLVDKLV